MLLPTVLTLTTFVLCDLFLNSFQPSHFINIICCVLENFSVTRRKFGGYYLFHFFVAQYVYRFINLKLTLLLIPDKPSYETQNYLIIFQIHLHYLREFTELHNCCKIIRLTTLDNNNNILYRIVGVLNKYNLLN